MPDLIDRAVAFVKSHAYIDLTTRQLAILGVAMAARQPMKVREMARELKVSRPVVTRALTALSGHGLVERRRGEDKRDRFIHVTDAGHAFRVSIGDDA